VGERSKYGILGRVEAFSLAFELLEQLLCDCQPLNVVSSLVRLDYLGVPKEPFDRILCGYTVAPVNHHGHQR